MVRVNPNTVRTERKVKVKGFMSDSFFIDMLGPDAYEKMQEMNTPEAYIVEWQKSRIIFSIAIAIIASVIAFVIKMPALIVLGVVMGGIWYITRGRLIDSNYTIYKFNRALEFAKFTRLVVPYLRSDSNGGAESRVYTTLSAVVSRLDTKEDRSLLATLLFEMTQDPQNKQPYVDYAMKVGGTDFAITFMETLYDVRQGSANLDIVERLSRESNEQVQSLMDDIVKLKSDKLQMIATKATMPVMIMIFGTIVAVAVASFSGIDLKLPF